MYKHLKNHINRKIYPFHMPGHKANPIFLPLELLSLDITEIPGMDVLSCPTGILKDMQDRIASFYGADESLFLVNGSSAGVVAAVCYSSTITDGTILIPRNAHASVYNWLAISGAKPLYFMPEIMPNGLAGGVCPANEIFDNMPEGAAVLVVSPTYEGFVSDISAIAKRVHAKKGLLIVDEAHGAHFPFHEGFPSSAIENGADISINSFHKTLPALSQTAVIHIKHARVNAEKLKFYVHAMQTSSPSYLLMATTDYMLNLLWGNPSFFEDYYSRLIQLREALYETSSALKLYGQNFVKGENAVFDMDVSKLLFTLHDSDSAETASEILAGKYGVQMEMANGQHILAMTSVADTAEGFNRLKKAAAQYNMPPKNAKKTIEPIPVVFTIPDAALTPHEAINRPSKVICREKSAGEISAELIAKYPPGIAITAPGERIHESVIPFLNRYVRVVD